MAVGDINVTLNCYDCDIDVAYGMNSTAANNNSVYKEHVWCQNRDYDENYDWQGDNCLDEFNGESDYELLFDCEDCEEDVCKGCGWYDDAYSTDFLYSQHEELWCADFNYDGWGSWSYSSIGCSLDYAHDNKYCHDCDCMELSDGSYDCRECGYCVEEDYNPYADLYFPELECDGNWIAETSPEPVYYAYGCGDAFEGIGQNCSDCDCK
mmetsp:Transcript_10419/g.7323  ORF Transcript_10419/g.7323 Transcript_10419/m.7323 type:complete len:209 (-) Transcript_10419:230-856(-)